MHVLDIDQVAKKYRDIPLDHRNADTYEGIVRAVYQHVLRPDDVALDCGGNKGQHTFDMAKVCRQVYCFEAIPELANRLAVRVEAADYRDRILVVPMAVAGHRSRRRFTIVEGAEALSSFSPQQSDHEHRSITVQAVRLDDVISGPVAFIKLDVEGAEFEALRGAHRILTTSRPVLAFEFARQHTGDRMGYSAEEFFDYFDEVGYDVADVFGTQLSPRLWSKDISLPWYAIGWPRGREMQTMWDAISSVVPVLPGDSG